MELIYGFWRGMFVHLWQCTLILLPLFTLARALTRAPARVHQTFWNISFLKLFLPLSFFEVVSSKLSVTVFGASLSERYEAIPSLPVLKIILDPTADPSLNLLSGGPVSDWLILGISSLWGVGDAPAFETTVYLDHCEAHNVFKTSSHYRIGNLNSGGRHLVSPAHAGGTQI